MNIAFLKPLLMHKLSELREPQKIKMDSMDGITVSGKVTLEIKNSTGLKKLVNITAWSEIDDSGKESAWVSVEPVSIPGETVALPPG